MYITPMCFHHIMIKASSPGDFSVTIRVIPLKHVT